jgi:hypothetical protein
MENLNQTSQQDTQTTRASATELLALVENGQTAEAQARIESLSRPSFIQIARAVAQLDTALSDYALSWKGAEFWGHGEPFPAVDRA